MDEPQVAEQCPRCVRVTAVSERESVYRFLGLFLDTNQAQSLSKAARDQGFGDLCAACLVATGAEVGNELPQGVSPPRRVRQLVADGSRTGWGLDRAEPTPTPEEGVHPALLRLIAEVARDVWNETPLLDHLDAAVAGGGDRDALLALVSDHLGAADSDGSFTPGEFVDMTQWFWGMDNEMFLSRLRQLVQSTDPAADERSYGLAQRRAKRRAEVR
jgi:hypothetical protein